VEEGREEKKEKLKGNAAQMKHLAQLSFSIIKKQKLKDGATQSKHLAPACAINM
jgi:hypothetical protein